MAENDSSCELGDWQDSGCWLLAAGCWLKA